MVLWRICGIQDFSESLSENRTIGSRLKDYYDFAVEENNVVLS